MPVHRPSTSTKGSTVHRKRRGSVSTASSGSSTHRGPATPRNAPARVKSAMPRLSPSKKAIVDLEDSESAIHMAARLIKDADFLLISAGAGFSADSGLPTYDEIANVEAYHRMGITYGDLCDPSWLRRDPEIFYGFWGGCYNAYLDTEPHAGYAIARMFHDYITNHRAPGVLPVASHVYTSNVDEHFIRAGWKPSQVTEIHGNCLTWQCAKPCCSKTFHLPSGFKFSIDKLTQRARLPLPTPALPPPTVPVSPRNTARVTYGDLQYRLDPRAVRQRASNVDPVVSGIVWENSRRPLSRAPPGPNSITTRRPKGPDASARSVVTPPAGLYSSRVSVGSDALTACPSIPAFRQPSAAPDRLRAVEARIADMEAASAFVKTSPVFPKKVSACSTTRPLPPPSPGPTFVGAPAGRRGSVGTRPAPQPLKSAPVTPRGDSTKGSNHPRCPFCFGPARPNVLMFDDGEWVDVPETKYEGWLRSVWAAMKEDKGRTLVVLELGCGIRVPTIRQNSHKLVARGLKGFDGRVVLIRVNPVHFANKMAKQKKSTVSIKEGALQALRDIAQAMLD
ncbi:Sirtuin family [Carpediemonas membranifera]|uniref:Sirtuin family n=1 Tax=Carpediemonas membranifera TaxID=201153 RepID=A0A8J6E348_9EUKA|nr:Sirtuin family [Carpediemonas membranifera]|eukprot:KAG9395141.1 Sirtuin family [Carpediemonas membranifera]